jgi:hypothetical protein
MFGLFKDKKKELAKEIYGVFKPKIEFVKVTGKWESNLSIGDVLIGDDYLLGFLNTYIPWASREFGYTGQDAGLIMLDVYEHLDKTFGDTQKQQQFLEISQKAKMKGSPNFILGQDNALMMFLVFTSNNDAHKFSKDPIYIEANKYFETGEFKKKGELAKKILPKDLSTGALSDAPSNIIVAYRIFEQTFEKRLNKVFKVD